MLLALVATSFLPGIARAASFPVTQEWAVTGTTTGPAATQVADGVAERLREADTAPDPVAYPSNQTITSGTVVSGTFPAAINASDNTYLQLQESGTSSKSTMSPLPTALGSCNFASGVSGIVSDNVYASSNANGANCIYTTYGIALGSVTIIGVEVGYEAFTTASDQYRIDISWDGGATFPCSSPGLSLPASDPNVYSYYNFTTCHAWTPADLGNVAVRFTHVKVGPLDTNRLDSTLVRVTYVTTTNYVLNARYDWAGVPAGTAHTLSVEAHIGDENLLVQVLTPPATWNTRLTFNSVADAVKTYALTTQEFNGGAPALRFVDAGADATASQYWVDEVKVTTTVVAYALEVQQNVTGITGVSPILQVRGNISVGGENFDVQAWNFTAGTWDTKLASAFTSTLAWHNLSLSLNYLSGGVVRLRYRDTNPTDTVQGSLSLDAVIISTVPGNAPPGLTAFGAAPSMGNTSTVFSFYVRYTDVDNDPPYAVYLNVDSVLYPMVANNSADTTYTDGKDYHYGLSLARGTHSYSFQANASAGDRSLVTTSSGTVQVLNRPPTISNPLASVTLHTGAFYRRTFLGSDPDGDTLTWSLATNGSWLSLGSANGTLWGTAPAFPASVWVYVNVTDGFGGSASDPFTVFATNGNPTITNPIPSDATYRGLAYARDFNATDPDGDPLAWSVATNATWLTIGALNGTVWGSAPSSVASFWVHVTVVDGHGGSSGVNYTLAVRNRPPAILNPLGTQSIHAQDYSRTFLAADPEGDAMAWSMVTDATWMAIGPSNGTLWGRRPLVNATYYVNVTVADPYGGQAFDNYTLLANNTPPSIQNPGALVAHPNTPYLQALVGSDADGDLLRWSLVTNASWLSLGSANGTLWGTGPATLGTFYARATAVDGLGGSATRNLTVTVGNRAPVVNPLGNQVLFRVAYSRAVVATDPDGDALAWTMVTNATFLTVDATTGTLTAPAGAPPGTYTVTLEARDAYGGLGSAMFTLTLVNRAPVITSSPATTWTGGLAYVQHLQGSDPDGDNISWHLDTDAAWMAVDPATGELRGSTVPGVYAVNLSLVDAYGARAYLNYTLTVQAPPTTTNLDLDPLVVGIIVGALGAVAGLVALLLLRRRPSGEVIQKAFMFSDRGIVLEELVSDQAPEPPIKFRDIIKALGGEGNLNGAHDVTIDGYHVVVIQDQKVHLAAVSQARSSKVVSAEARKLLNGLLAKEGPEEEAQVHT